MKSDTGVKGGRKCKTLGSIRDGRTKYWLAWRKRDDSENFSKTIYFLCDHEVLQWAAELIVFMPTKGLIRMKHGVECAIE